MAQLEVLPRDTRIPELLVFEPEQVEIALGWEIPLSSLSHLCNYLGCRLSSWKFGSTRGTANPANSTGNRADKAVQKAPIFPGAISSGISTSAAGNSLWQQKAA